MVHAESKMISSSREGICGNKPTFSWDAVSDARVGMLLRFRARLFARDVPVQTQKGGSSPKCIES